MALHRRWLLIWFALILGGGQSFAATHEERAYSAAVQAFDDKLYPVAENRLTQYLQTYHKSTNAPAALLLLAQAEYYLGNYPAVTNRLGDSGNLARARTAGLADQYLYWRAEAQFAQGDLEHAAGTFVSLAESSPNSQLALNAVVEGAASYGKLGKWMKADELLGNANGPFQQMALRDPANATVADGRLLQAQSKYAQREFAKAVGILRRLNPAALTSEQNWQRAYLLYQASAGVNDLDTALTATADMLEIASTNTLSPGRVDIWTTNLAESVASHADVLERQGRLGDAAAALQTNLLSSVVPPEQRQQTILKIAELAFLQHDLTNAESGLAAFVDKFPGSPKADIARVTLGELHLNDYLATPSATNHLLAAEASLLAVPGDSQQAGKANLALGWCHWLAAQAAEKAGDTNTAAAEYSQSFTNFQAAAGHLPVGRDMAVARFKMGDTDFALGNFAGAKTNYQAVAEDFSGVADFTNSLASRARYQMLRSHLALHDVGGVDESMGQFLDEFATNVIADSSLLLGGQGFSDFGRPAKAREVFLKFQTERPDSPLSPEVAFAISRTFELEQNWKGAVTNDEAWLKTYRTNAWRPQVEFARNWAMAQTGDEDRAFALFTNYPNLYPTSTNTPLAYMWIADHFFRQGTNFVAAEYYYETIFQEYPTNELANLAQLMAGRAAMGLFNPKEAKLDFFNVLKNTNCPDDLQDQARFGYCEALWALAPSDTNNASLIELTNVLSQMTPKAATNIVGALAWSETGDCNLQMGALDAATNAYAQVLLSPAASQELRNQAEVGMGKALEKKAENSPPEAQRVLQLQALNCYTDVIYTTNAVADAFYTKKAALQALPLMMSLKTGDPNRFFDTIERWLPQLKDTLEKKRAALTE